METDQITCFYLGTNRFPKPPFTIGRRTSLIYRMKRLRIIRPGAVSQKRTASGAAGEDGVSKPL